jgi:hypothetical protein
MHVLRLFPRVPRFVRLFLTLSLALSPVLSAWHGGLAVASPADTADHGTMTGGGHMQHHAAQPAGGQQDQASSGCTQHDACLGQCCPGCAHCAGALMSPSVVSSRQHPLLAPREPLLIPLAFVTLRERPPRILSV